MKSKHRIIFLFVLITILLGIGCSNFKSNKDTLKEANGFALGGLIQYKLIGEKESTELAFQEISQLLKELEDEFSANDQNSFLSTLTQEAYQEKIKISATFKAMIDLAWDLEELSEGKFTPLVGPLVKLWNIGFSDAKKPGDNSIKELLPLLVKENLLIEEVGDDSFISFLQPAMSLDIGAIVKGYAAQEALRICRQQNLKGALISINGNLAVYGQNTNDSPWRIGLIDPERASNDIIGSFTGENITVATSGDYERYFIEDGLIYHHILDATNGHPVDSDLRAVSIISEQGALADGLSTVAFLLGKDKGMALLNNYENLDYLLVAKDNSLWSKDEFKENFIITNDNYHWGEVK